MPFQKGQSGNPGGRAKVSEIFKAKARASADELVIQAWDNEVRTHGPEWMRASENLAAYAHGKPAQPVTGEDGEGPVKTESVVRIYLPDNGREKK